MRYLIVLLLLAGCATPEEQRQAYIEDLTNHCTSFGFRQGTDEFSRCMVRLHEIAQQRQSNDAATNAVLLQEAARGLNQPATIVQPPARTTTSCVQRGNRIDCM